jgi:hypothetical protein
MRTLTALALLLVAAGCSSAGGDAPGFAPPAPEPDSGGDVIAPPTPGTDAAPTVDSGAGQVADARHEADAAPALDVARVDVAPPDAGASPEASSPAPDAGSTGADAAPPRIDAGIDAGGAKDAVAGDVDAGNAVPICPGPATACDDANTSDALIRATFTQACTAGLGKCGGVLRDGIVDTLPMVCWAPPGTWRLAGSWSGSQWVAAFTCSKGCGAAGKLCDP